MCRHECRHGEPEMKRDAFTLPLDFPGELLVDLFAGGGGASEGIEAAFGRPVDIAVNHDPEALAMHAANHPFTRHYCESVFDVDPLVVTRNQPVGLLWLSPDCKHFSKAKGSKPVDKNIRGLAWVALRWGVRCFPRTIALENVVELLSWGGLLTGPDGKQYPDPAKKGMTFRAFKQMLTTGIPIGERVGNEAIEEMREALCNGPLALSDSEVDRLLDGLGYQLGHEELRACDYGAPTIRKRLFMMARRDGLPIVARPQVTHAAPTRATASTDSLNSWRTAAECIDFSLHAESIFARKRGLVKNTLRRVAKGLWRHVLTSANPYIVCATPIGERGVQPSSFVAPAMVPMRGTSEAHLGAHNIAQPLSTISAGGTHHALVAGHMTKFNTGSVGYGLDEPMATITAGGTPKRPSTGITQGLVAANLVTIGYGERKDQAARAQSIESPLGTVVAANKHAVVAAHLVDMGHGESSKTGAVRWSHGIRSLDAPLNTVTASGATSALAAAHLEPAQSISIAYVEQANGGFYDGDGRSVNDPLSTITSAGSNQRLISAYCVKYYSNGGQSQALSDPMHTLPTKGRMGLVQVVKVQADCLAPELMGRARMCAALLHEYLPEHFPEPAELVLVGDYVLVDLTLRMLKPSELYKAQGFREDYIIKHIPDPKLLFKDGQQVAEPGNVPMIELSATAQVRMCGNSVCPPMAEAFIRSNFAHELEIYGRMAA